VTPALFVSHGAPSVALENDAYTRALAAFGSRTPRPAAVVVVSAHWEAPGPLRVNAASRPEPIYDFSGFPQALYKLDYPAPGSPEIAAEIVDRLAAAGFPAVHEIARGWDHGVWVPLRLIFPEATLPVVELSLPVPRTPEQLLAIGRSLAPLRERDLLIVGSGGIVHNLSRLRWHEKEAPVDEWARAFDDWVMNRVSERDVEALAAYRSRAPHADQAVPTSEHFDPLFVVLGAAPGARVRTVYEGIDYGNLSMRTFALET